MITSPTTATVMNRNHFSGAMLVLQISDEQIIHSHTPLQTLPSLLSKHCVIIGQGQSVSIVQQEYPLTCEFVYALVVCFSFTHESITEYLIVIIITITLSG